MKRLILIIALVMPLVKAKSQILQKESPFIIWDQKEFSKNHIKTMAIAFNESQGVDKETYEDLYGFKKNGKKYFLVTQEYKNGVLSYGYDDTLFYKDCNQTGYECCTDSSFNKLQNISCNGINRIVSKGNPEIGDYSYYEYSQKNQIMNEYLQLFKAERTPFFEKINFEYDSLKRVKSLTYYRWDSLTEINHKAVPFFKGVVFKYYSKRKINYGENNRIKYVEDYDYMNQLLTTTKYSYNKFGLLLSITVYNNRIKTIEKKYLIKYTFW